MNSARLNWIWVVMSSCSNLNYYQVNNISSKFIRVWNQFLYMISKNIRMNHLNIECISERATNVCSLFKLMHESAYRSMFQQINSIPLWAPFIRRTRRPCRIFHICLLVKLKCNFTFAIALDANIAAFSRWAFKCGSIQRRMKRTPSDYHSESKFYMEFSSNLVRISRTVNEPF